MVEDFFDGMKIVDILKKHHVSYGTLKLAVVAAGGRMCTRRIVRDEGVCFQYENGLGVSDIAEIFKVCPATVHRIVKKQGLTNRSKKK